MSLEDIKEFVKDGCILERIHSDIGAWDATPLCKRTEYFEGIWSFMVLLYKLGGR